MYGLPTANCGCEPVHYLLDIHLYKNLTSETNENQFV